jgi:hypothetical protein
MDADVSLPLVVLFFEGTGRSEVFQKIISGLQRGGRRVHVFATAGMRPPNLAMPEPISTQQAPEIARRVSVRD